MTKYNKSEIMKKANSLRRVYGMSKSEALRKAWGMAKENIIKSEMDSLCYIDSWRPSQKAEYNALEKKLATLLTEIYPMIQAPYFLGGGMIPNPQAFNAA